MNRRVVKQTPIPFIGVYKQLLGGAMSWVTLLTFAFSGIAAWNTHTMTLVRDAIPWLTLPVFAGILTVVLHGTMWLEHKFIQPSVMVYWNKMFYNHGNPIKTELESIGKRLAEIERKLANIGTNDSKTDD